MVTQWSKLWAQMKFRIRNVTVEPIIFLISIGVVFGSTIQAPGIYKRICEIYYGDDSTVSCASITSESVEENVQQHTALWSLFHVLAYLFPAIFADTILGAYGDKNGRKTNILLGICGIVLSEFGFLLTLSYLATPYWTTLIFSALAGMTGFISMIPVSCNAYLADTTDDWNELTIRSGIFSSFQILASALGAFIAAAVASGISIPVAIDIELFLLLLAFLYTLWRIPQKPGLHEIDRKTSRAIRPVDGNAKKVESVGGRLRKFLGDMAQLLQSGFSIYIKKRDGHRRAFMFITIFVLIISLTTSAETRTSGIITSFVFRRTEETALDWDASDLGLWNGSGYIISLMGTLGGLFIFKKMLHLRETTIILIGLLSSCLRTLFIACSINTLMMYIANIAGIFSGLVQPAAVSFVAQLIPQSEIGRVFSLFGIGTDVAFIISTVIFANIYRATVPWSAGFLFYFISGIEVIALLAMFWVHIRAKAEGIGKIEAISLGKPTSVQSAISRIGEAYTSPKNAGGTLKKKDSNGNKMGKRQVSIIAHAEELANQLAESALWESMEDIRANRSSGVNFY
ncbi:unnamed protein product [Auanema sp. JU1783]|nr:unnamed protein product [Auanema sp. JU1783]